MDAYRLMIIAALGFFVFALDKDQKKFPAPIILIATGMVLAMFPYFSSLQLTKEFIFQWILPALLFTTAYQFPLDQLKKKASVIITLGTLGIFLSAILLGLALYAAGYGMVGLSFSGAMLIASLLIPTDPVTVVSILNKTKDKHHLAETVEGESLLNDGTSIVLFSVFSGYYLGGQPLLLGAFTFEFIYTTVGGALVGLLIGWFTSKGIHYIDFHVYQIWLTILLAYGSFYIGETLGVSGVIATVICGLLIAKELTGKDTEKELRRDLKNFWGTLEPFLLSIIFIMIGIESIGFITTEGILFTLLGFLLSILVRGLVLLGMFKTVPSWRKVYTNGDLILMTWGGIKGAMSLALLLSLTEPSLGPHENLLSWAFMMIMLSLLIQSLTFYPLKKLIERV